MRNKLPIFLITFYQVITKDYITFESEGINKEEAACNLAHKMIKQSGKNWQSKYQFISNRPKMEAKPLTFKEFIEFKKLNQQIFKGAKFVTFSKEEAQLPDYKRYDELCKRKMYCMQLGVDWKVKTETVII